MDFNQLGVLIKQGESITLELKKSTAQLKSACESVCAFLNTDGGTIVIGVTDTQRVVGQEVSDKTKREIGNELAKITPVPNLEIIYVSLPESKHCVIVFHITTDSTKRPYFYDGRAFIRIQSDTLPMPREYLHHLTMSNSNSGCHFEDQIQDKIIIDELDINEILVTLREGTLNGRIPESYSTQDPCLALQRLGLLIGDKITNAAIILFGKEPAKIFPQCLLRLARFRGTTKSEFIDNKQVTGNAFKLMRSVLDFANTYLPIASIFPEGSIQRVDTPLFPILALREAFANAICHRNWDYRGGSVSFAIFDDRLEIWSYGLLPPGVSLTNLKRLNQSVPRNRKIANVLYYHKLFESWGRGVQMIIDECMKAGHPEPSYTIESGGVKLTLPSKQVIGSNTVIEITQRKLTKQQQMMLDILKQYGELSTAEIHAFLKNPLSERWIRGQLLHLKELGYIKYSGRTRSRKWSLQS
jgi:ATP-dependent DNA helicase RecG